MNERELVNQLKILKNISPDKEWTDLLRSKFITRDTSFFARIFSVGMPHYIAIPSMAVFVAVLGGVGVYNAWTVDSEVGASPALTASLKHVSSETIRELTEIQGLATGMIRIKSGKENMQEEKVGERDYSDGEEDSDSHTVVFNKDADERENFQALLRERIKTKIDYVADLFAQVDNSELVREITQNQRRYEENFKFFGEGLAEQIKVLLNDAEKALSEGDLITALDLVNAIEKLIKS